MGKRATGRSAACATCGKTFARSDTLLRHERSHHATEDRGPLHRVTHGTFRACCSCAQARSRCSGGSPCGRCSTRNLECIYPNKRRKDTTGRKGRTGSELHMTGSPASPPGSAKSWQPGRDEQQLQQQQQQHPGQQYHGHFQKWLFSSTPSSPYATTSQSDLGQVNATAAEPQRGQIQLPMPPSGPIHHDLVARMPQIATDLRPTLPSQMEPPGNIGPPHQLSQMAQYNSNMAAQVDYRSHFGDQQPAHDERDLYDQSLSLNWIPLSVYPSPYGDIEQDLSFLLPSLSETAGDISDFGPLTFDATPASASRMGHVQTLHHPPDRQRATSISGLMQSPNSTSNDSMPSTGFWPDSGQVSEVRRKRPKVSSASKTFQTTHAARTVFFFPDMSMLSSATNRTWCPETKYSTIHATFRRLCIDSPQWKPFSTSAFPGPAAFNDCIDLYFQHLHPTFPLVHAPTFTDNANWLLCLATAAIGSTFAVVPDGLNAREAFQEFLRRAVLTTADEHDGDFRSIHLAQARILALIGLTQSDREQLRSKAPRSHADIARWCLESSILQVTAPDEAVGSDEEIDSAWKKWIARESLRRVGYFIWYLDCALGYIGNSRPLCNMDDARAPLPCPDSLWNASTAQEWLPYRNNTPPMPSLCAALETMYNKKKIDPGLSEISHILLIHALYSRTWEVGTHIKQPLSEWQATGSSKGFLNTPSKDNFWLPLYPLYANWRNSACDCLDVLHWQATGIMARNAGAEHHGILHLHLARVILLTPFQEIQDLLFFLINHRVSDLSKASFYVHDGSYQPRNPAKLPQIRNITSRWLREDQHKARLAMIHAGSVFWYVRRYSTYSFFEPLAVYLASIVLWTYGSYKSAATERGVAATVPNLSSSTSSLVQQHNPEFNGHSGQVSSDLGIDPNVQSTRVERAAQEYVDKKSRSSATTRASMANINNNFAAHPNNNNNHNNNNNNSLSHLPSLQDPNIVNKASDFPEDDNDDHRYRHHHAEDVNDSHLAHIDNDDDDDGGGGNEDDEDDDDEDDDDDDDDDGPTFIHLDRPCDDEIVQHFVRNGHNMSGHMSNVGDICQTPRKVLLEGAKILRTKLGGWGVSREYHEILTRLAEIRKDKGDP